MLDGLHGAGRPAKSCSRALASTEGEYWRAQSYSRKTNRESKRLSTPKPIPTAMANPQLSHMPSGDFSIARKVMDDAVAFHLANGGPTVARQHVEQLANELKFYSDINEAYLDAMARIAEAERTGRQPSRRAQTGPNGKAQPAQKGVLPPKLASGRAMFMWRILQQEGLIDDDYQPVGLSRTMSALLANDMITRLSTETERLLGIDDKWKPFEQLWDRSNMKADYNHAMSLAKTRPFLGRLNRLLAGI